MPRRSPVHQPDRSLPTLRVRVPCSTSNLGPGFDCLGLALALFLEVELAGVSGSDAHEFEALDGEAASWPRDGNLLTRAFDAALQLARVPPRAFRFRARSQIPLARGFGSSGAAVAAGLSLARALCEVEGREPRALDTARLCALGSSIEGHPDNSTASLLGGCTLAVPIEGELVVLQPELSPALRFAVAWPPTTVSTARARAVLPARVAFADAVENPRRLALLLEGLRRGDPELLARGGEDRLHVQHRLALVPGAERALANAREAGAWLATISGSGSGLFAIASEGRVAEVAAAMGAGLRVEGADPTSVQCRALAAVLGAPRVERS